MKKTQCAMCSICGSACGLILEVENNRIVTLRGDADDPHSRGHVCQKGMALPELHSDPDRVLSPRRKTAGGAWESVSWDAALDDIAGRLADITARRGADAVALYAGDAATHHYANLFAIAAFQTALGTKNYYSANSLDSLPRQLTSYLLYGNMAALPIPDVSRTDYLLILGGNPVVTNGSVMCAPGFARHITELHERGGRLVVVDPRRSETARLADEHYFIRPAADALFLLAVIHVIFEEKRDKLSDLRQRVSGLSDLRRAAHDFSPEAVSGAVGVSPVDIRKIARDFSSAPSACCYGRMGVCAQAFGTTATWLTDTLNVITGNIDRPGGAMFPKAAIDLSGLVKFIGLSGEFDRWRTRSGELPEFNGELPAVEMAAEMEQEGPRRIRALISVGGNPAAVIPNSPRLVRAMENLEFIVSVDPLVTATNRRADYILPPTVGLEHDYYPIIGYATAIRNTAKYALASLAPPPGVRHDWEILWELTQRLVARGAGVPRPLEELIVNYGNRFEPKNMLKVLLEAGPNGAAAAFSPSIRRLRFRDLLDTPHGVDLGLHTPQLKSLMGAKRVNLAPAPLIPDIERLRRRIAEPEQTPAGNGELLLISRRQRRFLNTWMHNIEKLAAGPEQCVLEINSADAAPRGIESGERVVITTKNGSIEAEVEITGNVMPGVVSLPFGWNGGRSGSESPVVERHPGASVNDITDETLVDAVSGMSAFNGTPVAVERAPNPAPN